MLADADILECRLACIPQPRHRLIRTLLVFKISCVKAMLFPQLPGCLLMLKVSGGDFLKGDGTGSFSIYGDKFPVCYVVA